MSLLSDKTVRELADMLRWWRRHPKTEPRAQSSGSRFAMNLPKLVRADSSVASGASGTFSVYFGDAGSESDTGENITARNKGDALDANDFALAFHNSQGWYVRLCECDEDPPAETCNFCEDEAASEEYAVTFSGFTGTRTPLNGTWYTAKIAECFWEYIIDPVFPGSGAYRAWLFVVESGGHYFLRVEARYFGISESVFEEDLGTSPPDCLHWSGFTLTRTFGTMGACSVSSV